MSLTLNKNFTGKKIFTVLTRTVCDPILPQHIYFYKHVWPWMKLVIGSITPFLIICVSNVAICYRLYKSINTNTQGNTTQYKKAFSHNTIVFLAISIAFMVTNVPNTVYILTQRFVNFMYRDNSWLLPVKHSLTLLQHVNCAVNFYLYCLSGSRFREELKSLCTCTHSGSGPLR